MSAGFEISPLVYSPHSLLSRVVLLLSLRCSLVLWMSFIKAREQTGLYIYFVKNNGKGKVDPVQILVKKKFADQTPARVLSWPLQS